MPTYPKANEVLDWNKKLYDYEASCPPKELGAEWFWENWKIKSAPKFRDECWYHIPPAWGPDVHNLVTAIINCFGDKVKFKQIKEKFATLTVYTETDQETRLKISEMVQHTQTVLRNKGLHP